MLMHWDGAFIDRDIENSLYYSEVKGYHCAQPFQRMFLKFNGNVTICCVDDKDETIVGNWREENLKIFGKMKNIGK